MLKGALLFVSMSSIFSSVAIRDGTPSANLRSSRGAPTILGQIEKQAQNKTRLGSNLTGDGEGDPSCEKGVVDGHMSVCCAAVCGGNCGEDKLCKDFDRFQKLYGLDANVCCKSRIFKSKAPSCDVAGPPCIMKAGYGPGEVLRDWKDTMEDCDQSTGKCSHRLSASLAAHKGDFLVRLEVEGTQKYQQAKAIAQQMMYKCDRQTQDSNELIEKLKAKIKSSSESAKVEDPLTGQSQVSKWQDAIEDAEADVDFYSLLLKNSGEVMDAAREGITGIKALKLEVSKVDDMEPLKLKLDLVVGEANLVYRNAQSLTKMFKDATNTYSCGAPPAVKHAASVCKDGDTKLQRKCDVRCEKGFDGEGTRNALRCKRQGTVGEQLYGEWGGMAVCVGRICGQPKDIPHAKTVNQSIRHPHHAVYTCLEGFSDKKTHTSFKVPCGTDGNFHHNLSHVCEPVKCGQAPVMPNTKPVRGTFHYADIATYKCEDGYTVDEMPGGLREYSVSCQSTSTFSQGVGCKKIRCGPPPEFENTKLVSATKAELHFGDKVKFRCDAGYTTTQATDGPGDFMLFCSANGEFQVAAAKGSESKAVPKCLAVSAGIPPVVDHGKFTRHEMYYGDSAMVVGDSGYSTSGKPTSGSSFTFSVSKDGTFLNMSKFIPVLCGKPPTVTKARSDFHKEQASFGDLVEFKCEEGFSHDKTDNPASKAFTVKCEADGTFTDVPGLGHCVNIDDCAGHTCGPHGTCQDHLSNYTCDCESGYAQRMNEDTEELHCGNVDDCGPEACGVGKCVDLTNDYKCECPSGYEQVEEFTEKVGKDAKTDKADKTCQPVTCGTPPEVENGASVPVEAQDQKLQYTGEVVYRCADGYSLDGSAGREKTIMGSIMDSVMGSAGEKTFTVKCQADKKFSGQKECKPIKCERVPKVAQAVAKGSSATFNESVAFDCEKGHSIDGTAEGARGFSMTCQATGEFIEPEDGFKLGGWGQGCRPVSCGDPVDVPNAHRPSTKLLYDDSVNYECFSGFTLDGTKDGDTKFKVECQEDGKLTKVKQCLPKACGKPLPEKVLYASTQDEGLVRYPMNTEVVCQDGYTVDGDATGNKTFVVTCLSSGEFEDFDPKQCKPVVCGEPPELANASFVKMKSHIAHRASLNYGERAVYECKTGFTTGGEWDAPTGFEVACLASGQFSAPANNMQCRNVNDCEGHTCGPKGTCVDLIGAPPAYTCQCEAGYHIEIVDGEKVCGKDACKNHDCGVGLCTDLIGDYTCTCPSGYYIGMTKEDKKSCIPAECSAAAPVVENGKMVTAHVGAVVFPITLRYECEAGYSVDSSASESKMKFQTQCRADGQLHGLMGCQKVSCGTPHILPHVKLLVPSDLGTSVDFEDKAKYQCEEGYTIKGRAAGRTTFEVTCQEDGILTDPEVCEPVKCGEAPAMEKTQIPVSGGVFYYGQGLAYQCVTGYTLDGKSSGGSSFRRSCLKTGKFSSVDEHSCKPISADVPSVENAVLTKYNGEEVTSLPARLTYPNGVEYTCKSGYSANGSPSGQTKLAARVDSTGKLSPTLPAKCEPIKFVIRGQVKDARNGGGMRGVSVSVKDTDIHVTTSARDDGHFTLRGVPFGNATLVYFKEGAIKTMKQIFVEGDVVTGGASDVSMSPKMSEDQWRVVLKWNKKPLDLDSYLKWGSSKVFWSGRSARAHGISGQLEHDDTSSYGPETVHISGVGECEGGSFHCDLRYYVNDYGQDGNMLQKGADVTLYTGERVAGAWKIKDCPGSVSGNGNWWHVMTLDAKTNKLKWSCDMGASTSDLP